MSKEEKSNDFLTNTDNDNTIEVEIENTNTYDISSVLKDLSEMNENMKRYERQIINLNNAIDRVNKLIQNAPIVSRETTEIETESNQELDFKEYL